MNISNRIKKLEQELNKDSIIVIAYDKKKKTNVTCKAKTMYENNYGFCKIVSGSDDRDIIYIVKTIERSTAEENQSQNMKE